MARSKPAPDEDRQPPSTPTHPHADGVDESATKEELVAEVRKLRALLAQRDQESTALAAVLAGRPPAAGRSFAALNVVSSFVAGAIFVVADSYWGGSPFAAGSLYVLGGVFLLMSIPVLHASRRAQLLRPLGARCQALACAGWFLFAVAVLVVLSAAWYTGDSLWLLTSGGVLGIVSQVLLASSVLALVPRPGGAVTNTSGLSAGSSDGSSAAGSPRSAVSEMQSHHDDPLFSPSYSPLGGSPRSDEPRKETDNFKQFLAMNTLLIVVAVCLALAAERAHVIGSGGALPALTSFLVTVIAIFLTHGLGGRFQHSGWSFFHCWKGQGTQFIVLQILTWTLFLVSVACQVAFVGAVLFVGYNITKGLMYIGGMTALASEILLILSIRYFRKVKSAEAKAADPTLQKADKGVVELPSLSPFDSFRMALLFNTQFVPFAVLGTLHLLPFALGSDVIESLGLDGVVYKPIASGETPCDQCLTPGEALHSFLWFSSWVVLWFCSLPALQLLRLPKPVYRVLSLPLAIVFATYQARESPVFGILVLHTVVWCAYIMRTYNRNASRGGREWDRVKNAHFFKEVVPKYFGGRVLASQKLYDLAAQGKGPLKDVDQQYMAGFHPHGIMPISVIWFGLCNDWGSLFPRLRVTPMVASVMHFVPMMRDMAQWFGVREVSRSVVEHTLKQGRTPCVVVGGQSEMFESKSRDKNIKIVRFHRGFFRVAIQHGTPLLPVYSFGETKTMDLFELPAVQRWFKRRIGFPLPYIPYGRWYLPIPRRRAVTVVVGAPVDVEKCEDPTSEQIDAVVSRYYDAVEELFEEFKVRCGHGDHSLQWMLTRQ